MQQHLAKLKELIRKFEESTMEYFSREQHARADLLSKLASTTTMANNKPVIQEIIEELSISPAFPFPQSREKTGNSPSWSIWPWESYLKKKRKLKQ